MQGTASHKIELEQAEQVGALLAATSNNEFFSDLELLHETIDRLVGELDAGVAAHFAKRLGVRKTTVHYWKRTRAPLTLDAIVRCTLHCNIGVLALMQGDLTHWSAPSEIRQLALKLYYPPPTEHRNRQEHDWPAMRRHLCQELQSLIPKSVAEIARSLEMDERLLYIQATNEVRQLGERYLRYRHVQTQRKQSALHLQLQGACERIHQMGDGISATAVRCLVDKKTLNGVQNLYTVLSNFAANDEHT